MTKPCLCLMEKISTFSRVEDTIGLLVTNIAALRLAVVLESTGLAEVVPAPGEKKSNYTFKLRMTY